MESQNNNRDSDANEDAERERRDLAAQEAMALWARAMFWATVAMAVLSAVGIVLIYITFRATRLGAEAAVLAQRPWLDMDIEIHGIGVHWTGDGYSMRIELTAKNVGNTPANKVRTCVLGTFFEHLPQSDLHLLIAERDAFLQRRIEQAAADLESQPRDGPTILPRDQHIFYLEPQLSWDFGQGFPTAFAWLTVGLRYAFPGSDGTTIKTFKIGSFGFPNDSGFDFIGDQAHAFSETKAIVHVWSNNGMAT